MIALALAAAAPALSSAATPSEPRLVLLLVVDQLGRQRLDPSLPGGLGRLAREGRVFANAVLDHAISSTCPGHVVLLSGRHPGRAGVPDNRFVDRQTGEVRYCVDDPAPDARVIGGEEGRSPRLLRFDALGDWMKAADPSARVFSVSPKDRAAITLGGVRPDGVYWLQRTGKVGFTTSRYYRSDLPDWLRDWNGSDPPRNGFLSRVPKRWDHRPLPADGTLKGRPDDYPAESPEYGRSSGHPIWDEDPEDFVNALYRTPFLDELTLDLAAELMRREGLGRDEVPDLLAVSLSATDTIGHQYGPESHEAADALLRLDEALGRFLDAVEQQVGPGRVLVALSADHGVLPLPEWMAETGRSECPVAGGRVGLCWLMTKLLWKLHRAVDPWYALPWPWLQFSGVQGTVDRELAEARNVSVSTVVAETERILEAHPAIAEVWTAEEIRTRPGPLAELYRHSFDPERSGDFALQFEPTCLVSPHDYGTTHMTPYLYDRAVPLLFFGAGVSAGVEEGAAASVDLAPTLAALLGIPVPADLDGRALIAPPFEPDRGL